LVRRSSASFSIELPRAEHDLPLISANRVAVDVDIQEVVVATQDLVLAKGDEERAVVPQAQVVDGGGVLLEDCLGKPLLTGEAALLDRVEVERGPRRGQVLDDVGPDARLLGLTPMFCT
jgi:hypothetical protein